MQRFAAFDLTELKLVYRTLHQNLMSNLALMDTDFLSDLQHWLQTIASSQGVDVSDHSQWDAWLGNQPTGCAQRVAQRTVIPFPTEEG